MAAKTNTLDVIKIKRREKTTKLIINIAQAVLLVGLSFVILFPILSAIIPSITDYNYLGDPNSIWIPKKLSILSYNISFYLLDYTNTLFKSLLFSGAMTLVQVIVSAFVGYGFSRMRFKGHNVLFFFVVLTIVLPPQAIMLPQFLHFKNLGLLNNIASLFLLALTGQGLKSGLFIYLFRQFFKGLPEELEEAALIDGCGFFKTFFKIMLPNAGAIILTVSVFSFVWNYTDTYYANWFAGDAGLISSVMAKKFISDSYIIDAYQDFTLLSKESMNPLFVGAVRGSGMLLYILPLAIFYFIIQRRFVQGFERSGIVG